MSEANGHGGYTPAVLSSPEEFPVLLVTGEQWGAIVKSYRLAAGVADFDGDLPLDRCFEYQKTWWLAAAIRKDPPRAVCYALTRADLWAGPVNDLVGGPLDRLKGTPVRVHGSDYVLNHPTVFQAGPKRRKK